MDEGLEYGGAVLGGWSANALLTRSFDTLLQLPPKILGDEARKPKARQGTSNASGLRAWSVVHLAM